MAYPDSDRPTDGVNLEAIFEQDPQHRMVPIFFRYFQKAALIDNQWKLLTDDSQKGKFELYDVVADPSETTDVTKQNSEVAKRMRDQMNQWNESVDSSFAGKDYPEGKVNDDEPQPRFWTEVQAYQRYFDQWRTRWEYRDWLKARGK